jgi:hypothetical protein
MDSALEEPTASEPVLPTTQAEEELAPPAAEAEAELEIDEG